MSDFIDATFCYPKNSATEIQNLFKKKKWNCYYRVNDSVQTVTFKDFSKISLLDLS